MTPTPQQLTVFILMRQQYELQCTDNGETTDGFFDLVEKSEGIEGICDTLWYIIEQNKIMELYEEHDMSDVYDACGQSLKDFILSKE